MGCVFSASLYHLVLLGGERLMAMKCTFKHRTSITISRLLTASFIAWSLSILIHVLSLPYSKAVILPVSNSFIRLSVAFIIFCHVTVNREVRRHGQRIAAHQITQRARGGIMYPIGARDRCIGRYIGRHLDRHSTKYTRLSIARYIS